MSTVAARLYNFVDDKNAGTPITASRVDGELDNCITKLNQKVIISATTPSDPIAGMLWLDSTNKLLKEYRNSEWVVHAAVHIGASALSTAQEGDMWWDTGNDKLYVYKSASLSRLVITSDQFGTLGQMLVSQGTGSNPISIAFGTANQYLKSNGIGSAPEFASIFPFFGALTSHWTTAAIGTAASATIGSIMQAPTDLFVIASITDASSSPSYAWIRGFSDSNVDPTQIKGGASTFWRDAAEKIFTNTVYMPVRKNDYWKITGLKSNDSSAVVDIYSMAVGS